MRQAPGNNLCAYYVCENIRIMTSERSRSERQLWVRLPEHYPQFFYHDLIYIHTTNIFILISFFKADGDAGKAPTNGPHTSTSRGNCGIFGWPGHTSQRRIPLHLMPACNYLQIVGEIVCTKLYIYIYVCVCVRTYGHTRNSMIYIWLVLREILFIYAWRVQYVCSSVKYVWNEKELNGKHKINRKNKA
jgi:hypothetical protein